MVTSVIGKIFLEAYNAKYGALKIQISGITDRRTAASAKPECDKAQEESVWIKTEWRSIPTGNLTESMRQKAFFLLPINKMEKCFITEKKKKRRKVCGTSFR